MSGILALTDWVTIGFGVANLLISSALGIVVMWLGLNFHRIEKLEANLKNATEALVSEKITHAREVYAVEIAGLVRDLSEMRQDLLRGNSRFAKNEQETGAIRVEVLKAISDLKDMVATKDDLDRLRDELRGS